MHLPLPRAPEEGNSLCCFCETSPSSPFLSESVAGSSPTLLFPLEFLTPRAVLSSTCPAQAHGLDARSPERVFGSRCGKLSLLGGMSRRACWSPAPVPSAVLGKWGPGKQKSEAGDLGLVQPRGSTRPGLQEEDSALTVDSLLFREEWGRGTRSAPGGVMVGMAFAGR